MYPDCLRCGKQGHGPACDKCRAYNRAWLHAGELQRVGAPGARAAMQKALAMVDGTGVPHR